MLNHTGGTNYHGGVMDYPRIPLTGWNLGKFPDSTEFQSWNINFRNEVCLRTADPQVTMLWIKEVEIAKSIGDLVTSRSITLQQNFLHFERLDAMIASALKKLLNTQSKFWKRVVSKSSVLTICTDSHDEGRLRAWSTSISVQPELMKQ